MWLKLMIFWILTLGVSHSDEPEKIAGGYDARVDIISESYEAGPYLIYDCEEKHWACVLESYYKECENKRSDDILNRKTSLRCVPVGGFPTKKSCFQRQLFMTGHNFSTRFCVPEFMREKEIRF